MNSRQKTNYLTTYYKAETQEMNFPRLPLRYHKGIVSNHLDFQCSITDRLTKVAYRAPNDLQLKWIVVWIFFRRKIKFSGPDGLDLTVVSKVRSPELKYCLLEAFHLYY